jgi:predicted metal-binding membrane protein
VRSAAARWPEAWLLALEATCLTAWSVLALGEGGLTPVAVCSAGLPPPGSFDATAVLASPAGLASGWALMVAAMMAPLLVAPLRHVRDRSFARRRARAMALFVAGYATVWMSMGVALWAVVLSVRWAVPDPLGRLGLAVAVALVWQVSPARQWCLNRCHRRPHLSAFGVAADRDAFAFGLTNGAACAGACWALMLLPLMVGRGHLLAMLAVMLLISAERLESPAPLAWRWRGPGKALRIAVAQARIRLAPRGPYRTGGPIGEEIP